MTKGLLIVGIVAYLGVLAFTSTPKHHEYASGSWQTYSPKDAGYSVSYPGSWQVQETNQHDVRMETRFSGAQDVHFAVINALQAVTLNDLLKGGTPLSKESKLKQLHNVDVEGLEASYRRFKTISESQIKIAEQEACTTTFEYYSFKGMMGRSMKGMVVTTWNGQDPITIKFVSPASEYEDVLKVFMNFLSSFKPVSKHEEETPGPSDTLQIPTLPQEEY